MKKRYLVTVLLLVSTCFIGAPAHAVTSCPQGTIEASISGQCIASPSVVTPFNLVTIHDCDTGFTFSSSQNLCVANQTNYSATVTPVASCNSGDILGYVGSSLMCTHPETQTTYGATSSNSYSCPNGGTLSGSTCTVSSSYSPSLSASCPSGYSNIGGTCTKISSTQPLANVVGGTIILYCPSGYTASGSGTNVTCSKTEYALFISIKTCPNGGSLNASETACITSSSYSASSSTYYSCPNGGSLNGTTCYVTQNATTYSVISTNSYSCNNQDTLSGQSCLITVTTKEAYLSYTGTCANTYYTFSTALGTCTAQAFTPIIGPVVSQTFLCTTTDQFGAVSKDVFSYDSSYTTDYGSSRTCSQSSISVSPSEGLYICSTYGNSVPTSSNSYDFISTYDATNSKSTGNYTVCYYTGDYFSSTDYTFSTDTTDYAYNPFDCQSALTFDEVMACYANFSY